MKAINIQENIAINYFDMPRSQMVEDANSYNDTKDKIEEVRKNKKVDITFEKCYNIYSTKFIGIRLYRN